MTSRSRLLARVHGMDTAGIVWAIEPDGSRQAVYSVANLQPDYRNLLAAAPLMLRAIDTALPMLDTIAHIFETHDMDAHAVPIMQLEAGLNIAKNAALFGHYFEKKR